MTFPWSAERAAEAGRPKPEIVTFTAKTAGALAEQVAVARTARRSVGHRPCTDLGACRFCAIIRDAHTSINDHLDQLEVALLEQQMQG